MIKIVEEEMIAQPNELDANFIALGFTSDERKKVYRAVCQLVKNRLTKAKSE